MTDTALSVMLELHQSTDQPPHRFETVIPPDSTRWIVCCASSFGEYFSFSK